MQILQAGTKDEINSQSYPWNESTVKHNSLPNRTKPKAERSHRPHRRSHPSRKAVLVTHGTQTSIDDEQNEAVQQAQSSKSSARQPSTRPNMGTNQLLLKNQNQVTDNTTPVSQQTKVSKSLEYASSKHLFYTNFILQIMKFPDSVVYHHHQLRMIHLVIQRLSEHHCQVSEK